MADKDAWDKQRQIDSDERAIKRNMRIKKGPKNYLDKATQPKKRRKQNAASFAIMRIKKLKSFVQITGAGKHNNRDQDTPNADPSRLDYNQYLIGTPDLNADIRGYIGDRKIRKNAVLCIEQLLTASPEFFERDPSTPHGYNQEQLDQWVKKNLDYLGKKWGKNCVNVVLHLDESTPHMHAYIVPLDFSKDPNGKLNAKGAVGGTKYVLRNMQTEYANDMKPLGLNRGIEKSRAHYKDIKRLYSDIQKAPDLGNRYQVPRPPLIDRFDTQGFAQRQVDKARKDDAERILRLRNQNKLLRHRDKINRQRLAAVPKLTEAARQVRDIDLPEVMKSLGAEPVSDKTMTFQLPDTGVEIEVARDQKHFKNLETGREASGAISLVMDIYRTDFKSAVRLLSGKFDASKATASAMSHQHAQICVIANDPLTFIAPEKSDEPLHLDKVREHLINKGLPVTTVDQLINKGNLYAQFQPGKNKDMLNAVILVKDKQNKPVGAEVIGVTANFQGVSPGSDFSKGVSFSVGPKNPDKVAFVSTALEALAYSTLYPTHRAISLGSTKKLKPTPKQIEAIKKDVMYDLDGLDGRFINAFQTSNEPDVELLLDGYTDTRQSPGEDFSRSVNAQGKYPVFETFSERLERLRIVEDQKREEKKYIELEKSKDLEVVSGDITTP